MIRVEGRAAPPPDDGRVSWVAAAPAAALYSFSGSGMPFPGRRAALEDTPNHGCVAVGRDGAYAIDLLPPNAYYAAATPESRNDFPAHPLPPQVHVRWTAGGREYEDTIALPDRASWSRFRTLRPACRWGAGAAGERGLGYQTPDFALEYGATQEERLRARGFHAPDPHWNP